MKKKTRYDEHFQDSNFGGTTVTDEDLEPNYKIGGAVDPIDEDEVIFDSIDELPEFEDFDETDFSELDVDGDGVIEPTLYDGDDDDPELGSMPVAELPMTEPVIELDDTDDDLYASEDEVNGTPDTPFVVQESFILPENKRVAVSKGDNIFLIGRADNSKTPKFAESAYKRSLRSLIEAVKYTGKMGYKKSEGHKKVSVVGRSCLVEVAKDWRLPGTDIVFEEHDLIQIVSKAPVQEKQIEEGGKGSGDINNFGNKRAEPFDKKDGKKAKTKKEAYRRWLESHKKGDDDKDKDDGKKGEEPKKEDPEGEPKKGDDDDKKKQEAFLKRHGIYF